MKEKTRPRFYLILHNIRSLYNVGAIFRTAEGAGIDKIFLTGYTPSPLDRFGKPRKEIIKTALGAEEFLAWEHRQNLPKLISALKAEKVFIAALENARGAVHYRNFFNIYKNKIQKSAGFAFILGNELRGLSRTIIKKTDALIFIPMLGRKESLNVAVAAGIAVYEASYFLRQ